MTLRNDDDHTPVEDIVRTSRHLSRQDILNEKRMRNTDLMPAIEADAPQSSTNSRQFNQSRDENRRLRKEIELLQRRLAQQRETEMRLDQHIETIHRGHQLEIEQYQNSLRLVMEELNEKRDMLKKYHPDLGVSEGDLVNIPDIIQYNFSTIRIRIMEEPLTARNFKLIISALTELHTKCWLIANGRFADLIEYSETHDSRFEEEANLIIVRLTHNSPAEIKLNVNADASFQGIAEALKVGIDGIAQMPLRREEARLRNEMLNTEIKLKEEQVQSELADKEQTRNIEAQKADIERRERQLELDLKLLAIQEKRFEIAKKRLDYAIDTASKMVNILRPNAEQGTKEMLLQTLLTPLLQLGNGQGLELVLTSNINEQEARVIIEE